MGLHDRLSKQNGNGAAGATAERPVASAGPVAHPTQQQAAPAPGGASDPYAELKSGIHHAVIAKLGPELFKRETGEDLTERVLHAVTEQLALDRTPLTREERRRIVREITDDVLGYGPLEELLRDDSITEVMVNRHDLVFVEREGRIERTDVSFVDNAHLLRIIDKIVSQVGRRDRRGVADGRRAPARRQPRQRDHPAARAEGADADDPEVRARPVHDGRPDQLQLADAAGRAVPGRVRQGEAERPHLGRYRLR